MYQLRTLKRQMLASSLELPLPGFTRHRPQFLQSRKVLLGLVAIVSIYLLYGVFGLWRSHPASPRTSMPPIVIEYDREKGVHIDNLRQMSANTGGFYARDWSLYLGWNNVAYPVTLLLPRLTGLTAAIYH